MKMKKAMTMNMLWKAQGSVSMESPRCHDITCCKRWPCMDALDCQLLLPGLCSTAGKLPDQQTSHWNSAQVFILRYSYSRFCPQAFFKNANASRKADTLNQFIARLGEQVAEPTLSWSGRQCCSSLAIWTRQGNHLTFKGPWHLQRGKGHQILKWVVLMYLRKQGTIREIRMSDTKQCSPS